MSDDQWLETILMNEASYIEDDGFTDTLMGKLPVRRKKMGALFESTIILAATLLSLVMAVWVVPGFDQYAQTVMQQMRESSFLFTGGIFVAVSAGISGLSYLIGSSEV